MTHYYKAVENGIIMMIGTCMQKTSLYTDISGVKYTELMAKIMEKPDDTIETKYMLDDATEEYKVFETTRDEKVEWYCSKVTEGKMMIADVPEEYRAEVQQMMDNWPGKPNNPYGIPNEVYTQIQKEEEQKAVDRIINEVSNG